MLKKVAQIIARSNRIKSVIYPVADYALRLISRRKAKNYDLRKTRLIVCPGRSGSTWLAELSAQTPGYSIIWEPLHPGNNPVCRNHGFGWQTYLSANAHAPKEKEYLHRILSGKEVSVRTLTSLELDLLDLAQKDGGFVVKMVQGNMILPFVVEHFTVKAVFMMRHPCAVVASQVRHGGWDHITKKYNYS